MNRSAGLPHEVNQASQVNAPDFPRQFARTRRFSLGTVRHPRVSSDGARVLFLRTGGGADPVGRLWVWEDGAERLLADPRALTVPSGPGPVTEAERSRRERLREQTEGVTSYAADADARLVAFALGGALWAVRAEGGGGGGAKGASGGAGAGEGAGEGIGPFPVPAAGPVADPRPSPDGRLIAYVTGGALHVVRPDGTGEVRLAAPEGPEVTYGLTDYVSAESMGRMHGYWWAPDGGALLAARVDTSRVHRRWITDPADPAAPPRMTRYPAAGTANADVSLHLLHLDGRRVAVDWDRTAFEYVVTAGWDGHGPLVTVLSRDQRTLAVDPASGATRVLAERRDPWWVEIVPGAWCRTASGALVSPYESGDTRRLRVGGETVTPVGLQLGEVLGTQGESVLFTAGEDPTEEHVWRYTPGQGCLRISDAPGKHHAAVGGDTLVLDSLTRDGQEVSVVHVAHAAEAEAGSGLRGAVRKRGIIASRAEKPSVLPRPFFLSLGDRQLRSALFLPSWYVPGAPGTAPLPVLLDPYNGPGARQVMRARHWSTCVSQWFAEQGFAVLVTDGRGTPGRGPAWEKAVRGDQLTPVLADQIDALRTAARSRPYLDLGRVAIRGWSFGGILATAAVLRHPDVFHAAVAGAAPSDQRLYDTHWKERFLGHPDEEPENYDRCSLLTEAPLLRRPLLLVHGTTDDNVAFANTLRLSAALLAAGREHTVLPLPGQSHMVTDEAAAEALLGFQLRFLREALARRADAERMGPADHGAGRGQADPVRG
ncbi:alpha/beta fold hydrolase [Streptomyces sp. NPDC054796]